MKEKSSSGRGTRQWVVREDKHMNELNLKLKTASVWLIHVELRPKIVLSQLNVKYSIHFNTRQTLSQQTGTLFPLNLAYRCVWWNCKRYKYFYKSR